MHATAHILDEPTIREAALPITVAQDHRLSADGIVPERTELLRGAIIEQMTKSPLHTFLVQRLAGWLAAARLVIEVAGATVGIDRAKADVYAAAGVEECWVVIPESRTVEIHRLPAAVGYGSRIVVKGPEAVVQPESLPGAAISIDRLFA